MKAGFGPNMKTNHLALSHTHACTHTHTHTHTPMYINAWKHLSLSGSMSMRSDTHTQSHNNFRSKTNTNISLYSLLTNLVFGSEGFASMCKKKKRNIPKNTEINTGIWFPAFSQFEWMSDLPKRLRHRIFFNKQGWKVESLSKCYEDRHWSVCY